MPVHAKKDTKFDIIPTNYRGPSHPPKNMVLLPEERVGSGIITQKKMNRVEMHDFSCRCMNLIRPVHMEAIRCGLCGSGVTYPYRHFKLVEPTIGEILGR